MSNAFAFLFGDTLNVDDDSLDSNDADSNDIDSNDIDSDDFDSDNDCDNNPAWISTTHIDTNKAIANMTLFSVR